TNRKLRMTLMCRAEVALDRALAPAQLQELYVAGDPEKLPAATNPAVRAAFAKLAAAWPGALPFAELGAGTGVARAALGGPRAGDGEPERRAPAFTPAVAEGPRAPALARWPPKAGAPAPTLRHGTAELDEAQRKVLPLLDGTRTAAELAATTGLGA